MKKVLLFVMLLMPMMAFAQYIDEKKAREIAASAFKESVGKAAKKAPAVDGQGRNNKITPHLELHRVIKNDEGDLPCFYIYNQKGGDGGFAIVSNQGQLLGYSDHGVINYDSIPDNLRWLLGQYQKVLSVRHRMPYPDDGDGEDEEIEETPSLYRESIDPLIGSEWHQGYPFNDLIKKNFLAFGGTYKNDILAGCSAIAMAQVMYYWKYPERGTGSKDWKLGNATYIVNFEDPIDWNHIGSSPSWTGKDDYAYADLAYRVAASIDATVEDGATSANNDGIAEGLVTYFDYDKSIRIEWRTLFRYKEFEDIVYDELKQNRPCILGGSSVNDHQAWPDLTDDYIGHNMVIEGYNAQKDMFFINMGWGGGSSNAYYKLCVENSSHKYVISQNIVTHIMPNNHGRAFPHIVAQRYSPVRAVNQARPRRSIDYDKSEGQKTYHVSAQIFSNDMDANIVTGIIAKDYMTGKECVFEGPTFNLTQGYLQDMDFDIDLSKIVYNGYYQLRPVFRLVDDNEWFTIEIPTENEDEEVERTCVDVSNAEMLDFGFEVEFTLDQTTVVKGRTTQIEYKTPIKGVPVIFTSSDPSIASVDENGVITALQPGEVTITAHCDDYFYNGNRIVKESAKEFQIICKGTTSQGDIIVNGDLAGTDMSSFQMKEYGVEPEIIKDAAILKGGGPNRENCIVVNSVAKVENGWDSQFWIVFNEEIFEPAKIRIKFQYKASTNTHILTDSQWNPGEYNSFSSIGYLNFTEEWQTYESTISVRPEMTRSDGGSGEERGFKSIAFYLSKDKDITFYFANIEVSLLDESQGSDDRVFQMSKVLDGVEYALYKRTLDVDDVHRNPDGWTTYRSELSLDVTKDGNKTTYIVDDDIYLDSQYGINQQRPCMMFDLNTRQIYIFCNSKDSGFEYSMDGFFYSSSLDDISFKKETVFTYANFGWWPYFVDTEDGSITINHFSYAGYRNTISTRDSNGEWNTYFNYSIMPDSYIEQCFQAEEVLISDKNNPSPDSYDTNIVGRVVVEEFTGTWCGWCPRGTLALDLLNKEYGDEIITIAVHSGDPMETSSYTLGASSFPSARVNRGGQTDPYYGNNNNPMGIMNLIEAERKKFAPAEIEVSAAWSKKNKSAITIDTKTTFQIEGDASQFGIGFVLVEDGMRGNGSSWAQANYYSGTGADDDPNLLSLTQLPQMITNIEYNHVAVDGWGLNRGVDGSIKDISINVPQEFSYNCDISGNGLIQDKSRLTVVALLFDRRSGKICNAAKTTIADYDPSVEPHYDMSHLLYLINLIMGGNATPNDMALYDLNIDSELNIGDVILIVKSILDDGGSITDTARDKAPIVDGYAQYASAQGGKELVANGDFEGSDFSSFVYKNADGIKTASANDIFVYNGNHCLKVVSQKNVANTWDSQFFVKLPEGVTLPPGTKLQFSMRVKASQNTTITTQGHNGPGSYLCWGIFGSFDVSTDWDNIEGVFTVPYNDSPDASPSDEVNTIAFDLNCDLDHSITFYFDDISIMVPNSNNIEEGSVAIGDVSLKPGETKDLNVMLTSAVNDKVGVQFDVMLPDGLSLVKNSEGKVYQLSANQPNDLACTVRELGNGTSRFIIYSKSLQKMDGDKLMSLHLKAASNIQSGNHAVSLGAIAFSDINGNVRKVSGVNATVNVTSTYKLTYMIDGKVYKEVEVEYGATITPEPQPEGDYVSFSWTGLPETMPAKDVTVQADYVTGINCATLNDKGQMINDKWYDLKGRCISQPKKGVNILRDGNGKTKVVVIK